MTTSIVFLLDVDRTVGEKAGGYKPSPTRRVGCKGADEARLVPTKWEWVGIEVEFQRRPIVLIPGLSFRLFCGIIPKRLHLGEAQPKVL